MKSFGLWVFIALLAASDYFGWPPVQGVLIGAIVGLIAAVSDLTGELDCARNLIEDLQNKIDESETPCD